MKLVSEWSSTTRLTSEKVRSILNGLTRNPMMIYTSSKNNNRQEPDIVFISGKLFKILKMYGELGQKLTSDGGKYAILKKENMKIRSLLSSVLGELKVLKGEDYTISPGMWNAVRESEFDNIDADLGTLL